MNKRLLLSLSVVAAGVLTVPPAGAQEAAPADEVAQPADGTPTVAEQGFPYTPPPIPPNVEEAPVAGPGGGYCYAGAHPVDNRSAGGSSWDDTPGMHTHFYPPLDPRLFALRDGCYYFIGDPVDFGYTGQTYSYYGAHPLLDAYGGGWCFMIGPHTHPFGPWSSSFVVVGPWY